MKKLTFEKRLEREKHRKQKKLDAMPILGMAVYGAPPNELNLPSWRLQIVKLTKHSVTMKMINGKGTIKVETRNGLPITNAMPIELMPCDIVPSVTIHGLTKKIPQGSDVPM